MEPTKENREWALDLIEKMTQSLPYGPTGPAGAGAVRDCFLKMVPSREIGEWLIAKVIEEESQSAPPVRLREILSFKYKPADEK